MILDCEKLPICVETPLLLPVLCIKSNDGKVLRLTDEYELEFYIQTKNEKAGNEINQILSDLELIKEIKHDYKLTDINNTIKQKLIYFCCNSIHYYNILIKTFQHETLHQRIR